MIDNKRFAKLSWGLLIFVTAVILWGAVVRATGSGAGCGSHWPTCNGEVLPTIGGRKTLIEFVHRLTAGLSALGVLFQLIWSRRVYEPGHRVRSAVAWAATFMVLETLIGAGIVLFDYVDQNKTVGRALWMSVHLVNTFMLMGALAIAAYWASGAPAFRLRGQRWRGLWAALAVAATLLAGMSGSVAALGDTLFPAKDLSSALAADLSATAHVFVRLRVIHPVAACVAAGLLLITRQVFQADDERVMVVRLGHGLLVAVLVQISAGLLNMVLLAPIWMQLVHLLLAGVVWVLLVLFLVTAMGPVPASAPVPAPKTS